MPFTALVISFILTLVTIGGLYLMKKHKILVYILLIPLLPVEQTRFVSAK